MTLTFFTCNEPALRATSAGGWNLPLRLWLAALCLSLLPCLGVAQDTPGSSRAQRAATVVRAAATGPRSSPFSPPTTDVFLTDASAGLDTGCTFNTSPLNPLTINVMIDRFVGDVDADGYLLNPTPLIAAGIIPTTVEILLPAFDIDFNGTPPPERDELLFNGQSLGFLTGDDNIWKLNSFRVDVRRIKFPARPAAGSAVVPRANRVQIRIDTLSVNRWCMSVDWVALLLPIRPKLALQLDVVAGNPVFSNTGTAITRVYEQGFDANCNVSEIIGPITLYPFSGPSRKSVGTGTGTASLRAKVKACPDGSLGLPNVVADWSIGGTSQKGSVIWAGAEGTVEFAMPPNVGAYDAALKLTLDGGQSVSATRRLFVTYKPPTVASPRLNWYEKGTAWANGKNSEAGVVDAVATGLYGYGGANWRYGYFPGKCSWDQLMSNPITCNYADCFVFSDVLTNVSGVLGVSGLSPVTVLGTSGLGFLTTGSPSLDPAFRGNAKPVAAATYDKYIFSSHSLRQRAGVYYDPTFNGRYASSTAFVLANFNGTSGTDVNGSWHGTTEGRRIYPRSGNVYDTWGKNDYALLDFGPFAPVAALGGGMLVPVAASVSGSALSVPGTARFSTLDLDGNGRAEQLVADIDIDIAVAGDYVLVARLESTGGLLIANRPALESMQFTRADLSGSTVGRRVVRLLFSGEQIRTAAIDGPWRIVVQANGPSAAAGTGTVLTPAYRAASFGERKLSVGALTASPIDSDANGKFDLIRVRLAVDVAAAGNYGLRLDVAAGGAGLVSDNRVVALAAGVQALQFDLPVAAIARSGADAPYDLTAELSDITGTSLASSTTQVIGYLASQFETPVSVGVSPVEQLIDSDGNGLFDLLRITPSLSASPARTVLIQARLTAANGASIDASALASLGSTARAVSLDFLGTLIRRLAMSSAYTLELSFQSPSTLVEFDAVTLNLRGSYVYSIFDSGEPVRTVALNGTRTDVGIDTNGNGLYDLLAVNLGVDLTYSGRYDWSARLVDRNGVELGFATNSGTLPAGSTSIALRFNGKAIGTNGLDGPFYLRSLLVAGPNGANLVSPFAGDTSAWSASRFEGFVSRLPGDLNGDGVIDAKDLEAFNRALGSSVGDPNYNRFADFDRDGRITLNDLRIFRSYYQRR